MARFEGHKGATYNMPTLKRNFLGEPLFPDPVPTNAEDLLGLMDEASEHAGTAQGAGAPAFDHGTRVFNQLKAHYDLHMARELAAAHLGLRKATDNLKTATRALKVATWVLAIITLVLGGIELWKVFVRH
jgi:hypothetical protein